MIPMAAYTTVATLSNKKSVPALVLSILFHLDTKVKFYAWSIIKSKLNAKFKKGI